MLVARGGLRHRDDEDQRGPGAVQGAPLDADRAKPTTGDVTASDLAWGMAISSPSPVVPCSSRASAARTSASASATLPVAAMADISLMAAPLLSASSGTFTVCAVR